MITMIAHSFCIVLLFSMFTSCNSCNLPSSSLDNSVWIRNWFLSWRLFNLLWFIFNFVFRKLDVLLELLLIIFQFVFLQLFLFFFFFICFVWVFWTFNWKVAEAMFIKSLVLFNFSDSSILIKALNHSWICTLFLLQVISFGILFQTRSTTAILFWYFLWFDASLLLIELRWLR